MQPTDVNRTKISSLQSTSDATAARLPVNQVSRRDLLKYSGTAGATLLLSDTLRSAAQAVQPNEEPADKASELTRLSATELAALIKSRKVSSEEVVRDHLDQIQRWNGIVNSVISLNKNAITRAKEADSAVVRGEKLGPLHGVPVTFKDHIETAGLRTTAGTESFKEYVPNKDATVVQRMKKAGAIVLGKTNVSQLAWAMETDNGLEFGGRTNNPFDLTKTSGGSSGGEAATIAYGGSPLGVGADGGGSIRLPAHYCGIAGLKPSWSRIPNSGTLGTGPFIGVFYDTIGPMARRVEDLHLALDLLKGPDGIDFFCAPTPLRDYRKVDITKLNVAYFTDMDDQKFDPSEYYLGPLPPPADQDTKRLVEAAAKHIGRMARSCDERKPPRLAEAGIAGIWIYAADFRRRLDKFFHDHPNDERHKYLAEIEEYLDKYVKKGAATLDSLHEWKVRWYSIASEFHSFMNKVDCIICPVNAAPALPHGQTFQNIEKFMYAFAFNHGGNLPGAVVRCGTSAIGLPIGVQIVGPPWKEEIALAVAAELEKKFGGWKPPAPSRHG